MNVQQGVDTAAHIDCQVLVDARGVNETLTVYSSSTILFIGILSWDDFYNEGSAIMIVFFL